MNLWNKIKPYLKWQLLLGVILGGIAGYLYYHFVGCTTHSCPITSNAYYTILWGVLLGIIIFFPNPKKQKKKQNENQGVS